MSERRPGQESSSRTEIEGAALLDDAPGIELAPAGWPANRAQIVGMTVFASVGAVLGVIALAVAVLSDTVSAALPWVALGAVGEMLAIMTGGLALRLRGRRRSLVMQALLFAMDLEGRRDRSAEEISLARSYRDLLVVSGDVRIAERLQDVLRSHEGDRVREGDRESDR